MQRAAIDHQHLAPCPSPRTSKDNRPSTKTPTHTPTHPRVVMRSTCQARSAPLRSRTSWRGRWRRSRTQRHQARTGFFCTCWPLHRSEEHTSELQSLMRISYAVFCLKKKHKKKTKKYNKNSITQIHVHT